MQKEKKDKLAWLLDKDIKDIKFEKWGLAVGFNSFYRTFFWYIILTVSLLFMIFLTHKNYDKFMYKYIFIGYLVSLCLSYIDWLMDKQTWVYMYIDENGHRNAFKEKKFRGGGDFNDQEVIIKGGKKLKDNTQAVYLFENARTRDKFIKKNNFQTEKFGKYIMRTPPSSNDSNWKEPQNARKWGQLDVLWQDVRLHTHTDL